MYSLDDIKKMKIGVLMGGWSGEREISLRSGRNVLNALKKAGCSGAFEIDVDKNIVDALKSQRPDVAFNALHGIFGEDGEYSLFLTCLRYPIQGVGF